MNIKANIKAIHLTALVSIHIAMEEMLEHRRFDQHPVKYIPLRVIQIKSGHLRE